MIVRRAWQEGRFTTIPNEILQRTDLSFEALGLLVSLLSRPPNWEVSLDVILKQRAGKETPGKIARDKLQRLFKELRDAGYAKLERVYECGRLTGSRYAIYDQPQTDEETAEGFESREPEKPVSTENRNFRRPEKQAAGKAGSHIEKTDRSKIKNSEKEPWRARHGSQRNARTRRADEPARTFWVRQDSDEGRAWDAYKRRHGASIPWKSSTNHPGGPGWWFEAERPPSGFTLPPAPRSYVDRTADYA